MSGTRLLRYEPLRMPSRESTVGAIILRRTRVGFLFVILVFVVQTLGSMQLANAAEDNPALIVYPGGTGVMAHTRGGMDQLTYDVVAEFPAADVIGWISHKLERAGWEPLKYDFLNPGLQSSQVTGWEYFLDGIKDPIQCIHQWLGQWKDAAGNFVDYGFRYKRSGCETSDLTDLEVNAEYIPAAVFRQMLEELKKEHEPQ